ncbi:TPA: hypothetical protein ACOECC_002735 [Enterobacter bugandensis]|uniref:hypothetical protein n=1 Tax=Enterobacter TaxID=547 RepID=UPI0007974EF5|nr:MULTISPECIES: hypothetical protein [Enterobacter]QPX98392.1 hypothetical protein H2Z33_03385 [Enterobacter sp. YSU]SAI40193.1 Uncharacterised protein [Enterobacter hormaechei]
MTNINAVEKMAELMQQMEENSPRVAALQYCLSEVAKRITELEQKLAVSQREFRAADATIENLQMKLEKMAAENAGLKDFVKTCFRAAADGASLDGADIQELGERLGLFGRETYQPVLHGYICGHEAGEDSVYVMKKTTATDAFLAEVRAQGAEECVRQLVTSDDDDFSDAPNVCAEVARQFRKGVQS